MKECKHCRGEVFLKSNNAKFCSIECRDKDNFEERQKELLKGTEGWDYVIDKWNGYATTRVYGHWFKSMHPNRTIEEYRQEFPGEKLQCDAISSKSGQHMKKDRHREAQRQRMLGAGNPNHTSKTTIEQRKAKSPFSKDFAKYQSEEDRKAFINSIDYDSIKKSSDIDWWITKCDGDIERAKELYKQRQTTFTLEKCIKKYGEDEGTKIFNNRQEKWLIKLYANFEKYGDGRSPQSKWVDNIKNHLSSNGFKIPLKEKWIRVEGTTESYSYDLTIGNKIIEFNGDYWHANPSIYQKDWFNKTKKVLASELWEYDAKKIKLAESHGYKVHTIWENDYLQNPKETIQKCLEFLNK
jgi:hypothetical protein